MKFEDGIRLSIKNFLDGNMPKELAATKEEGLKYTPEWFDTFEETFKDRDSEMVEEDEPKKKSKKKKKSDNTAMDDLKGLGYAE